MERWVQITVPIFASTLNFLYVLDRYRLRATSLIYMPSDLHELSREGQQFSANILIGHLCGNRMEHLLILRQDH